MRGGTCAPAMCCLLICALWAAACSDQGGPAGPDASVADGREELGSVPASALPNGVISVPRDYITLKPGGKVNLKGKVYCPAASSPCSYRWTFGDGKTSTARDPGTYTFVKPGFYPVTFTVTDAKGKADPTPSVARVAVWNGAFSDNFNRPNVAWDKFGWRKPVFVDDKPMWSVKAGWLHTDNGWGLPGSTAILAWPEVKDFHLEVTKRRQGDATKEHYSDVILRLDPTGGVERFYRVRFWEEAGANNGLEIAIFKIVQSADEHGYLLNDSTQPQAGKPTVCKACPYYMNYPRTKNMRIIVEAVGAQIRARIEDPAKPGVAVLSTSTIDTLGKAYTYKGVVGLTHFEGISFFDNFSFKAISAFGKTDAGPKDAGVDAAR